MLEYLFFTPDDHVGELSVTIARGVISCQITQCPKRLQPRF